MLTLKRLGVYLLTFFVVVCLVMWLTNWKKLDHYLVNQANKIASSRDFVHKEIVLVHLQKPKTGTDGTNLKYFRQKVIKFLNTIAQESKNKQGPKGIVLDIVFSNDNTELENLKAALQQLKDLKIPVYAVYDIKGNHSVLDLEKNNFDDIENAHASVLYSDYLAGSDGKTAGSGRYHTFFYPEGSVSNYKNDVYFYSDLIGDSVLIESLARKVALDLSGSTSLSNIPKREGSIVPYGSSGEMERRTYTFIADSIQPFGKFQLPEGSFDSIDIAENILVVGDTVNDVIDTDNRQIPGPYIVTWALSDLLDNNSRVNFPIENRYIIVAQALFFALFTVLVFALFYKYIKRLQTKPAVIGVLSFLTALGFLFAYGFMLLSFNAVIPIGHTVIAMAVAAILAWRFAVKFLATGVAEGSQKYDVFISYSRSQSEWVNKYIYEPLVAYSKPNGEKLNIFYDKKSIGIGESFTAKYMWAIVDSKYFLPILSDDYYGKNHCRNEIDLAYKRKVEKLLDFKILAFSDNAVPEIFRQLNYLEKNRNPDFINRIQEDLNVVEVNANSPAKYKAVSKEITSDNKDTRDEINKVILTTEELVKIITPDPVGVSVNPGAAKEDAETEKASGLINDKESINSKSPPEWAIEQDRKSSLTGSNESLLVDVILEMREVIHEMREDRRFWRDQFHLNNGKKQPGGGIAGDFQATHNPEQTRHEALLSFTLEYLSSLTGKSPELLRQEFEKKVDETK